MSEAVLAVRDKNSVRGTAICYGIPRSTLKHYCKLPDLNIHPRLGSTRPVFSDQQEKELVEYVLELDKRFYGMNCTEIRCLAFQLAERNNFKHPFNRDLQMAGYDWLDGFRDRHGELSLRKPEATSIARIQGFNRVSIDRFFDILLNVNMPKPFPAHRIYNVDETSVVSVSE